MPFTNEAVIYQNATLSTNAPRPSSRRRDANLQRILQAAMAQVEEDGLEALSIARVAAAADYTPGALYRYVPSKEALVALLVAQALDDARAHLEAATTKLPAATSPITRLVALVLGYADFARTQPHRFGLLATALSSPRVLVVDDKAAAPTLLAMASLLAPLLAAMTEATDKKLLTASDATERVGCLIALLHGALPLRKQHRHAGLGFDADKLVVVGVQALLRGWGATPRAVTAAFARVGR